MKFKYFTLNRKKAVIVKGHMRFRDPVVSLKDLKILASSNSRVSPKDQRKSIDIT